MKEVKESGGEVGKRRRRREKMGVMKTVWFRDAGNNGGTLLLLDSSQLLPRA